MIKEGVCVCVDKGGRGVRYVKGKKLIHVLI